MLYCCPKSFGQALPLPYTSWHGEHTPCMSLKEEHIPEMSLFVLDLGLFTDQSLGQATLVILTR